MENVKISVLIPVKNEALNIRNCLTAVVDWADEVFVIDSNSSDLTISIVKQFEHVKIEQFTYNGAYPKKRQWALDNLNIRNEWVLFLDADEILLDPIKEEIANAILMDKYDGFTINLQMDFLGKMLKYSYPGLRKLILIRKGLGYYEKIVDKVDYIKSDMEIHEQFIIKGPVKDLKNPILHRNVKSMYHFLEKHNEYSSWEAESYLNGNHEDLQPSFFGSNAQRRRFFKSKFLHIPGVEFIYFFYLYFFRFGFLDGKRGYYFCLSRAVHLSNVKLKIFELSLLNK